MRNLAAFSIVALLLAGACAVAEYDRGGYYGRDAYGPGWYGTVTYIDPYSGLVDVQYYDRGVYFTRPVYYGPSTRWYGGMSYRDLHRGERLWINGDEHRGRWHARSIRRY